jgi:hypothetical protein
LGGLNVIGTADAMTGLAIAQYADEKDTSESIREKAAELIGLAKETTAQLIGSRLAKDCEEVLKGPFRDAYVCRVFDLHPMRKVLQVVSKRKETNNV